MNLRDWTSNEASVQAEIPLNDRSTGEITKVLGLSWIVKEDTLSLNQITLDPVYDPLGLFSPITLQGKLFLQKLWNKKLSWDEHLSSKDKSEWINIKKDMKKLPSCRFPRYIGLTQKDEGYILAGRVL